MSDIQKSHYLALIKDDPENQSITATYTVYFINYTSDSLKEIITNTSGYASFGDQLITAEGKIQHHGPMAAGEAIKIGTEDEGSFDYDNCWMVKIVDADGLESTMTFSLHKYGINREHGRTCVVPVLHQKGYLLGYSRISKSNCSGSP